MHKKTFVGYKFQLKSIKERKKKKDDYAYDLPARKVYLRSKVYGQAPVKG